MFKLVSTAAGIGDGWRPRELRTSFVSLMSRHGVSIEEIARLVGHAFTRTSDSQIFCGGNKCILLKNSSASATVLVK
jgi:hypothetical protein